MDKGQIDYCYKMGWITTSQMAKQLGIDMWTCQGTLATIPDHECQSIGTHYPKDMQKDGVQVPITVQVKQGCLGSPGMAGGWDLLHRQLGGNLLQMSSTRVNWEIDKPRISLYIMTFHVSTGRSASLKLQSNLSAATGSSVGSWYGATYGWASDSAASMRLRGSKTSMRSRSPRAALSDVRSFLLKGWRSRLGKLWTKRSV